MIENRLFEARHCDALRIRFHPLAEGIGTVAEGVAALSEDGWIVGANQSGLALLGLCPADLGATPIARVLQLRLADLIDWGRRRGIQAMPVAHHTGNRLFVRIDPGRSTVRVVVPRVSEAPMDALSMLDSGDARLKSAINKARRIVGKPIALVLQGESGAGKEFFAKAFHDSAPRRAKPFIALNCATLPENLIEAELFGFARRFLGRAQGRLPRPHPRSERRHPVPRRNRRHASCAAGTAAARPAGTRGGASWRWRARPRGLCPGLRYAPQPEG